VKNILTTFVFFLCCGVANAQTGESSTFFDNSLKKSNQLSCISSVREISQGLVASVDQTGYTMLSAEHKKQPDKNGFDIFVATRQDQSSVHSNLTGIASPKGCQLIATRVTAVPVACSQILSSNVFKSAKLEQDVSGIKIIRNSDGRLLGFITEANQSCSMVELLASGSATATADQSMPPIQRCSNIEADIKKQIVSRGIDFPVSGVDTNYVKAGVIIQKTENNPETVSYSVMANAKGSCDASLNRSMFVNQSCSSLRKSSKGFGEMKEEFKSKAGGVFYGSSGGMKFFLDEVGNNACLVSGFQFVADLN